MKKLISCVLVSTMLFSLSVPAYADEASASLATPSEAEIQAEIEKMEQLVWKDLYNQLEAQDALDGIEYFMNDLRTEIAMSVYQKYGITPKAVPKSMWSITMPDGGVAIYEGDLNVEKTVTCLTPTSAKTALGLGSSVTTLASFLNAAFKKIAGSVIPLLSVAILAAKIQLWHARNVAEDSGYYIKVLGYSWGSGAESGSYTYAWDTYPMCYITDSVKAPRVIYNE